MQRFWFATENYKNTRHIPLFSALPSIKDWLDSHPQRGNSNAYLIPSMDRKHRKFGNKMKSVSMNIIYRNYKLGFFPALLDDPKVTPENKQKIESLAKAIGTRNSTCIKHVEYPFRISRPSL